MIIENCGEDTSAESFVDLAIHGVWSIEDRAFEDALINGIYSEHGFKAIFKSIDAKSTILAVLTYMLECKGLLGLKPEPNVPSRPRYACVEQDSAQKYEYLHLGYDPWEKCQTSSSADRGPLPTFYASGTAYIFICPIFHSMEPFPRESICPTVEQNRFFGDPGAVYQNYQFFRIIYEQIRFYLGRNALDAVSDPLEEFDWNSIVYKLDMIESLVNPTSLELYTACE